MQNKDVFMKYHKAHLTRRLILDLSNDQEMEEQTVIMLKVTLNVYSINYELTIENGNLKGHWYATGIHK